MHDYSIQYVIFNDSYIIKRIKKNKVIINHHVCYNWIRPFSSRKILLFANINNQWLIKNGNYFHFIYFFPIHVNTFNFFLFINMFFHEIMILLYYYKSDR